MDAVGYLPNVENLSVSTPIDQQKLEPATVVILNHDIFNDTSMNRPGISKDVESLYKTFHKLGCSIEVHHNPVFDEVSSTIKNLSRRDFKLQSALIIVILSHGHPKEEIKASDNQKYDLDTEVINPLLKNPTLKGKPKILVVQACKGVWEADAIPFRRDPFGIMKCYSTTEGFLSYRHSSKGSVYIQTFCEVMNKDALTKDFRAIVNDVNQQVIKKTEKGKKQVPSITSTLYESYCFGDFVLPALKCIAKPKSDPQRPLKASSINPTNPKPIKTPAIVEKILNAPRPLVLILNHHIFIDGRKREGTAQDVQALHRTFTSLNCDVLEILNPTWDVVKETFNKLEGDCLKHLPALVIVILSHGDRNDVIGTCDNKRYNLNEDVLYPLFRNETLVGKPKILITQACKGNLEVDAFPIKYSPTEYIKCYSTTEGFKSYRDPEKGSPYIQALCTHLEIYGQDWDFESLIREVGIQVASQTFEGKRQIPTFVPRLNKKFYFGHNVYTDGNPNTLNN